MNAPHIRSTVLAISKGYSKALRSPDASQVRSWLLSHGGKELNRTQLLVAGRERKLKFTFTAKAGLTHIKAEDAVELVCTINELDQAVLVKRLTKRRAFRLAH